MRSFALFAAVSLVCAVTPDDGQVLDAAAKLDAKILIEDSSEWFRHKAENEWDECSVTTCKDVSGEVQVFSTTSSDPTKYLRRSHGAIDRGVTPRNRARLNDNGDFSGEHWHCEADPNASDGCECMCSSDTTCYSVKHSDRFVKVCDGQVVEEQYTASNHHEALIKTVDDGVALTPGTDGVGNACAAGTYNIHGIGVCSPHTTCSAGEYLTGESASTPGDCTNCAVGTYNTDGVGDCSDHPSCETGQVLEGGESSTVPGTCSTPAVTAATYSSGIPGNCVPNVLCPPGETSCNDPATSYADLASAQADCDITPACYAIFNQRYGPSNNKWSNAVIWQMRTCNPGSTNCNQPATNGGTPAAIKAYSGGGCGNYNKGGCVATAYPEGGGCKAYFKNNGGFDLMNY